ncbi:MAG TPA: Ig-like domain-containing protein [Candidatus Limnocylindria bacterium]|nr:Ig-like domain-containing protein [Candidatus Limnocylindria bacterium]
MTRSIRVAAPSPAPSGPAPLAFERVVSFFAVLALVISVLVPPSAFGATRNWSLTRDPATVTGTSGALEITATNTGDDGGGEAVGCVVLTVPNAGFAVTGVTIDAVSDGDNWSASYSIGASDTVVSIVSNSGGGNRLHADEWIAVTIAFNTTGLDGTFAWTGDAYNKEDCTDDFLLTRSVTVTVNGAAPNSAPTAAADSYTTPKNVAILDGTPGVLGNDIDPEGDVLSAVPGAGPTSGSLVLDPNGSFTYTPDPDFVGTDSFTYVASDGTLTSAPATVTITVTNTPPVAVNDAHATLLGLPLTIGAPGVLGNDADADGDTLTAVEVSGPSHGSLTLNADGSFTYAPDLLYLGPDSFDYCASDGIDCVPATVTINITNTAPAASDDGPFSVAEDAALALPANGVLANDTDADGDGLTAVLVSSVASGSLSLNPDGSFDYMPAPDFHGTETFVYRADDGFDRSADAIVTIVVSPVNDDPVGADDAYSVDEDGLLAVSPATGVLANDADVDGDGMVADIVSGPAHGALLLGPDGSIDYAPESDYHGPDAFAYRVADPGGATDTATVAIDVTPVNDAPVAVDDTSSTAHGTPIDVDALGNDFDVDGDGLTIAGLGPASAGTAVMVGGRVRYTPPSGFAGQATVGYTVTDGTDSDDGVLVVTVKPAPTPKPTPTPSATPTPPPATGVPAPSPITAGPSPSAAPPSDEPIARSLSPAPASLAPSPTSSTSPVPTPAPTAAVPGPVPPPPSPPPATSGPVAPLAAPEVTTASFSGGPGFTDFGGLFGAFGDGFAFALSAAIGVPGLLFMVVVAIQVLGAAAWIPAIRRSLAGVGADRRRRAKSRRRG